MLPLLAIGANRLDVLDKRETISARLGAEDAVAARAGKALTRRNLLVFKAGFATRAGGFKLLNHGVVSNQEKRQTCPV
jgi:hypothetical protein